MGAIVFPSCYYKAQSLPWGIVSLSLSVLPFPALSSRPDFSVSTSLSSVFSARPCYYSDGSAYVVLRGVEIKEKKLGQCKNEKNRRR